MDRYNVIQEYMSIRHVMTPDIVQKAFKKTGIHPLDASVFSEKDFGPSAATSSHAVDHLPTAYPPEIPTSPVSPEPTDEETEHSEGKELQHISELMEMDACLGDSDDSEFVASNQESDFKNDTPDGEELAMQRMQTRSVMLDKELGEYGVPKPPPLPSYEHVMRCDRQELWNRIQHMYHLNKSLYDKLEFAQGQRRGAEAHCTIASRKIGNITQQLSNTRKKRGKSFKSKARFVTLPSMREQHNREREARKQKEDEDAQKQAQKKADEVARNAQVAKDIESRVFDAPVSAYKKKDDLRALAGALGLSQEGNCDDLSTRIKTCLSVTPDLVNDPRFSGLFASRRKRAMAPSNISTTDNPPSTSTSTSNNLAVPEIPATHQPSDMLMIPPHISALYPSWADTGLDPTLSSLYTMSAPNRYDYSFDLDPINSHNTLEVRRVTRDS
jgi:hypothetical protein